MSYKLYLVVACVFVVSFGDCTLSRGSFQAKMRHCKWLCSVRDSQQKNTIQTCFVLADHQNVTISKCVNRCLEKHDENVTKSTECQCENGKCKAKSVPSDSSSTKLPVTSTSPSPASDVPSTSQSSSSATSASDVPSTSQSSSSATSVSTESNSTPSSSTSSTTAPTAAPSDSPASSSQRSIDDFKYDDEIISEFE